MNPTDHAAKRDALQEAIALEVALRDKSRSDAERHERMIVRLEAAITALDATPVYPSVTFTDRYGSSHVVTFDGARYWRESNMSRQSYPSALALVAGYASQDDADAIVARLLALKGEAASGEPFGWVNVYPPAGRFSYIYDNEAQARKQAAPDAEETIPLYRTPVAYQKVGACLLTTADGFRQSWYSGANGFTQEWCEGQAVSATAHHTGGTAHVLYAGEALT